MWDLSSPPGIEPTPPALEAQSLYHWIAWEFPDGHFYLFNEHLLNTHSLSGLVPDTGGTKMRKTYLARALENIPHLMRR